MSPSVSTPIATMPPAREWSSLSRLWAESINLVRFTLRTCREFFHPPWDIEEISRQLYEIGCRSAFLILIAGLVVGIVVAELIWVALVNFGVVDSVIPADLSRTMFRQMGPLITGLLISGRVGASIGAELAALRITEQIDALESLAIDPFRYLVISRVIACVLALPILTTIMSFAEIAGGYIWEAAHAEMPLRLYAGRVFDEVGWADYIVPTLSTAVLGFLIGTVSAYLGYTVEENAVGVRRASMNSVVLSSLFVIAFNIVLSLLMSAWFPEAAQ